MVSLNSRRLAKLNHALLELYAPARGDEFAPRVLRLVEELIPTDLAAMCRFDLVSRRFGALMSQPVYDVFLGCLEHLDELFEQPHFRDGALCEAAEPVSALDLMSRRALEASALGRFILTPLGTCHDLTINFFNEGEARGSINLTRSRPFDAGERLLLDLFTRHLREASALNEARQRLMEFGTLDGTAPWLLCRGDGVIFEHGPGAQHLLRQLGWAEGNRLPEAAAAWLARRLAPPRADQAPPPASLVLARHGVVVHAQLNPLAGEHLLIFETRPAEAEALSPREAEVALWVALGKSNAAIALILGISPHTVKRHVEKVLAKLGVENRASVLAALLADPRYRSARLLAALEG